MRRRPLRRAIPILIGLAGALLLQQFFGAHSVELLLVIPTTMDDGSGVTVRITHAKDAKLVVQVLETARSGEGHTVVLRTKLPRGRYRADVWLAKSPNMALSAEFEAQGEDVLEVPLTPRPAP
jgi:hypothetical protein